MAYEEKPGSTTTPSVGGEYNDDGSSGISSYPIQYEGSDGEGGYQINPGATGNLSAGGEYDNLDTADSLSYTNLAAQSAGEAALSAAQAATSVTQAASSAASAVISAANAATSATNAANSATAAGISATNSANSATSASASAATATTKAAEASTSATNAANSATSSAASAATATTQATNAAASATIATTKASEAATSATNSADSATASANSATSSANSATTATTKAAEAVVSANSAASSATSAGVSATSASNSASAASTSETNAATSAANSLSSATSASNSATSANTSAVNSAASAATATTQAASAATSATTATTKAAEASASASSASSSAATATTKAAEASVSASNAATSATSASTSASNAATSATSSANSATAAGNSATNAALSASNASTSATNANTSANSAISAQAAAEAARDQALAAFDNFDDKYLGEKTSDPTTDNDGNPLVAGALYFNSVIQGMKVYTGTAWVAAYMSGAGYMLASNNLSELTNLVTARSNLGLGSSALANGYTLDELNDVVVTSVTDGQVLEYDSATNTWRNTTINALPSQATHTGQFLTTDGTNAAWASITGLPSQATHAGQYLKTDGTTASWSAFELPTSTYTRTSFNATAGQTTFSVTYTLNSIQVYVNGVLLSTSDYTATNGTSFVLASAANLGDFVEAVVYNTYGLGEVLAENIIGTVAIGSGGTGATTASGARTSLGLGTAATTDSTAYATSAQGTKADSALQPANIGVSVQGYNANTVIDSAYVHTDNNYTTTEKSKLAGIEAGAEVNVNADWNATTGDAAILNKPTLGTMSSQNADNVNITGGSITSGMVTSALGYTPYNSTNPSSYITTAGARSAISVTGAGSYDSATGVINIVGGVTSFNTRTGAISLTSGDVTGALGFTPYNSTNPNGYITSAALSPYLTSATAASTYLPLTGGTISGLVRINNQLRVGQNTNGTAYIDAYDGYAWFGRDSNSTGIRIDGSGNVNITGALTQGSNQVLHAGNYTSYSPSLTGSGASGTWGISISGNAATATSATDSTKLPLAGGTLTGNTQLYANDGGNSPRLIFGPEAGSPFSYKAIYTDAYWLTFQGHVNEGMRFRLVNGSAITTYATLTSSYLDHGSSLRAPIFYDLDNTGYYVDPASTSNLNALTLQGTFSNGSVWINNGTNSGNYNENIRLFNAPNGVSVISFSASGTSGVPTTSLLGYSDRFEIRYNNDWQQRTYNGYVEALGSFRAPIFYDSNDTGYYTDPRSTSNLFDLTITGSSHKYLFINPGNGYEAMVRYNGGSGNTWYVGKRTANVIVGSADFHFYSEAVGASVCGIDTSGNVFASGSSRAPIFYDSNNTAYYCDPNSVSRLDVVRSNVLQFIGSDQFAFGSYWAGGAGYPGYQYIGGNNRFGFSGTSGYIDVYTDGNYYGGIDLYGANRLVPLFDANQGGGALYSSIIYDSNSTGFYLDPSANTKSMIVNGNIELTARSESWGEGIRINVPTAGTWGGIRWNRSGASGPGNWALGYTGINSTDDLTFWSGTVNLINLNLDHSGNLIARGNITAYGSPSDRRLKENIQPLTGALNKVLQLQGCTFNWKKDSREHQYVGLDEDIGFIADDVKDIIPEMVRKGDEGYLSLRDRGFSALLVEAFKEQNQEIVNLKKQLTELKSLINKLIKD